MSIFIITDEDKLEVIDSLKVAKMLDKYHSQLLKDINRYINQIENSNFKNINQLKVTDYFIKSIYIDANNKKRTYFKITRKGCDFMSSKLMDQKKAYKFKIRYTEIFKTRNIIKNINSIFDSMEKDICESKIISEKINKI